MSAVVAEQETADAKVRNRETLNRWSARAASWLLLLAIWQFLSSYVVPHFILPSPGTLVVEMTEIIRSGQLLTQFGASLAKLGVSFVFFFAIGAVVGTLMALSRWWEDFLRDAVSVASSFPGLVYILVLLLIFGTSGAAPIAAIVGAVTPFIVVQFWEGVKGLPTDLIQMGSAFKVKRRAVVRHIMIPALTPFILTAVTHGISIGWRMVVLTEVFGGSAGIGFKMRNEFSYFSVRGLIAWALFFFIFSLIFDRALFSPISRWVLRWRGE